MHKNAIALPILLSAFAVQSETLPTGTTLLTQFPSPSHSADLSPQDIGGRWVDYNYCLQHERKLIVVAHADDDRYFMGEDIRDAVNNGACLKIVHVNAGFDITPPSSAPSYNANDPYYYQGRINGAKAVYADYLSQEFSTSVYQTQSWDNINGNKVHRYIFSRDFSGNTPGGQLIEVQVLGLPNSSNVIASSDVGTTISHLYTDHNETTINVADTITGFQVENVYSWDNVLGILNQIISWMNPTEILTLDPWGLPGDDAAEGQHPDHIMAARLVRATSYASSNPSQVKYFKTYNVNTFPTNLSEQTALKTISDVANHFSHDWGSSFVTNHPCSIGSSTNPESWACKQYEATEGQYSVAGYIENGAGQCLNTASDNSVSWGVCGSSSFPVTLAKARYAYSLNPNYPEGTLAMIPSSNAAGASISLAHYSTMPENTRWHFNDSTQKLEYLFTNSAGEREALCLDAAGDNGAILANCNESSTSTLTSSTVLSGSDQFKLRNLRSGRCLALDGNRDVTTTDCNSEGTGWNFNNGELSQSINGQTVCLNAPTFGRGIAKVTSNDCHTSSQGQRFDIRTIAGTSMQLIAPVNDSVCLEGDLNFFSCHGYQVQQWQLLR
ncbi:ricin-type beta-trefoil lectin domain protein [Enterovibrio paralichthyis]|uniref:ricin-type beta-trefoil lectin domain protein n=1 Tax=Enterovibrio paralichthyis TaxID=2853805 RepID=UPI001C462E23|nr:ricin-type beta-trefoil lectin domain protein [Enterovibrio paralichthyis]MBV7296718.1 PIG-L family deacetylase [Enterovibrio paralichthyis]